MFSVSIPVFAYDFEVNGDLFFDIISTAELTCKLDSVNENYKGILIIPERVSFRGRDLTVTTIGSGCIKACNKLTEVKIFNTVDNLESGCFSECTSLQNADISQFNSGELSSDIFKNCSSLTHVDFPTTVTYLPTNFFYGCVNLSTFEIPAWISRINSGCFYGCTSLAELNIPDGVESIGDNSFSNSAIHSISFPSTVQTLGKEAFKNVELYSALNLPEGLKSIGNECFYGASIPKISIPSSVESVGSSCFAYSKTNSIKFEEGSLILELGYGVFQFSNIESIVLPSNLEKIGEECFASCNNLKRIQLPESLKTLSRNCLANITLDSLVIPDAVDYMPEWCFGGNWPFEFASIKHFIWSPKNLNEDAYAKYLLLPSESSDITWAGYDLNIRSCYLGPIETFEISESCKFLSLGFFAESDDLYTGPLFKYSDIKKLIIDESDDPLILGSIYSSGDRRTYKLYKNFPNDNNCKYFKDYWMGSVEDLYIGREIDGNPLYTPNLKRLHIGNVNKVDIENSALPNLEIIESTSIIPPVLSETHFSKEQYMDLLVVVPDDVIENYRNAETWKNFWNLTSKSDYEAGVDKVFSDGKTEVARYDLMGNPLKQNYQGIAIIKYSDGTASKRVISTYK